VAIESIDDGHLPSVVCEDWPIPSALARRTGPRDDRELDRGPAAFGFGEGLSGLTSQVLYPVVTMINQRWKSAR
jgi:hypothetical protein